MGNDTLEKLKAIRDKKIDPMALQAPPEARNFADKMKAPDSIPQKELMMARMSALRASVEMAVSWAEWMSKTTGGDKLDDLAIAQKMKFHQETFYKDFLGEILEDSSIPF